MREKWLAIAEEIADEKYLLGGMLLGDRDSLASGMCVTEWCRVSHGWHQKIRDSCISHLMGDGKFLTKDLTPDPGFLERLKSEGVIKTPWHLEYLVGCIEFYASLVP